MRAILAAAQQLFMEQGFLGTTVDQITERAGVSKASLYTYFPSKRDVFLALGQHVHHSIMEVIDSFEEIPTPATRSGIEAWVKRYWDFMEEFGAFILVAVTAGPPDHDVRVASQIVQLQAGRHLGRSMRSKAQRPLHGDTALGLSVLAMIERSWFFARVANLPIESAELLAAQADLLERILAPER